MLGSLVTNLIYFGYLNYWSLLTLKAFALIPLLLILFWFALNVVSLGGRTGSFISRFSARESSSNNRSFEKAPSSISSILFPLKSILLKVALHKRNCNLNTEFMIWQINCVWLYSLNITLLATLSWLCYANVNTIKIWS